MAGRASLKQYLIVDENGRGHLPVRATPDGPLNHHLMRAAWAALHGGYRGNRYEGPGKNAAIEKLKALYRAEGMDMPDAKGEGSQIGRGRRFKIQDSRFQNGRRHSATANRPSAINHRQS
jgi:hypothetical protein